MIFISSGDAALTVAGALVIGTARVWRNAQDNQRATQPDLYRFLAHQGGDMLAPVLDSVFRIYEACARRKLRTGRVAEKTITHDEFHLLELLAEQRPPEFQADASPGLVASLRIALCSTRLMLRGVAEAGQRARLSGPDIPRPANGAWLRHAG